jgi:uncharacterized Zn-finger protein
MNSTNPNAHRDAGEENIAANTERAYQVKRSDLPLSCPTPEMKLWNSHPRVYLPIEKTGHAQCPYCGANFELIED